MTEKDIEKQDEQKESARPVLQGEALLQWYALRANDNAEDDHQDGCPCCLPR